MQIETIPVQKSTSRSLKSCHIRLSDRNRCQSCCFSFPIGDPKSSIFCEISFRSKIRRVCWINLLLKKWEVTFFGSENQPFSQKRASSTSQFREHRDPIYCTQNISLYFCLENGDQNKKIGNSPCLSDQLALFKACVLISN